LLLIFCRLYIEKQDVLNNQGSDIKNINYYLIWHYQSYFYSLSFIKNKIKPLNYQSQEGFHAI